MGQTEEQHLSQNHPEPLAMAEFKRVIFKHVADKSSTTIVFVAGLHGNEPSGVKALQSVFATIDPEKLGGNVYAITGNLRALRENRRYIDADLNRVWLKASLEEIEADNSGLKAPAERKELLEIHSLVHGIIEEHGNNHLVFIDLHTTSAPSCPFLPFNDALMNRRVAEKFPVPLILGIEEHLEGSFMSYINDLDFPALAFEGGSHSDPESALKHEAFIRLTMHHFGICELPKDQLTASNHLLSKEHEVPAGFYEILHRHEVSDAALFKMELGFNNFDRIYSGQLLAVDQGKRVVAEKTGRIFMPLYQDQGNDGFFVIRKVSAFWLRASAVLRKWHLQKVIMRLPGVRPHPTKARTYIANPRITRFLHREIFHLLGFRIRHRSDKEIVLIQRD